MRFARNRSSEHDRHGPSQRARLLGAPALAVMLGSLVIGTVAAYTVLGASFSPDHGAPGTRVVVEGLPLAIDCPTVEVWFAAGTDFKPPITHPGDPRLIPLAGVVKHPPIGDGGVGDRRPGTTFTFRVPRIAPATYTTYYRCSGGPVEWSEFSPGADRFKVDPVAPDTSTASDTSRPDRGWIPAVISLVAGLVGAIVVDRRRARSTRAA